MAKRYNIKWREADEQEVKRVLKNYNAKIRRLEKKEGINPNALPRKMTIEQFKNQVESRQDFNREINALKRFSKRGSEEMVDVPESKYNLKITKWQKQETERKINIVNQRRKRRRKEIESWEMTSGGKKLGYTVGEFGIPKADEQALKEFKAFYPTMSYADLHKRAEHINIEVKKSYFNAKEERLKFNYLKGLRETYSEDQIEDIAEAIENMDFKEFYKRYGQEGGTFEHASRLPANADLEANIEHLRGQWLPDDEIEEA